MFFDHDGARRELPQGLEVLIGLRRRGDYLWTDSTQENCVRCEQLHDALNVASVESALKWFNNLNRSHFRTRDWCLRRDGRGVMVHDLTIVTVLHKREAVAGGDRFSFAILRVGKRVVARVDRGVSVYADQLVSELDGKLWRCLKRPYEVGLQ